MMMDLSRLVVSIMSMSQCKQISDQYVVHLKFILYYIILKFYGDSLNTYK